MSFLLETVSYYLVFNNSDFKNGYDDEKFGIFGAKFLTRLALWNQIFISVQSTPVISRQLGAKIRERELSGSPVISRFLAKAQTRDFQDQSPTLWRLHLLNPNSTLSDNGWTYISRISADVDIAPATNHNKPYYISTIMHQKLSNHTLHKAAYDGICAETIQTTVRFDRKRK